MRTAARVGLCFVLFGLGSAFMACFKADFLLGAVCNRDDACGQDQGLCCSGYRCRPAPEHCERGENQDTGYTLAYAPCDFDEECHAYGMPRCVHREGAERGSAPTCARASPATARSTPNPTAWSASTSTANRCARSAVAAPAARPTPTRACARVKASAPLPAPPRWSAWTTYACRRRRRSDRPAASSAARGHPRAPRAPASTPASPLPRGSNGPTRLLAAGLAIYLSFETSTARAAVPAAADLSFETPSSRAFTASFALPRRARRPPRATRSPRASGRRRSSPTCPSDHPPRRPATSPTSKARRPRRPATTCAPPRSSPAPTASPRPTRPARD
ncbi:hypothetical protein [Nannocystis pusilla]|uniref:hypothetical protein n=1 Tax=Nannocystis pusilla TaxID=889268 RepID=UPI003B7A46EB